MAYGIKLEKLKDELSFEAIYAPADFKERHVYTSEVNRPGMELIGYHKYFEPMRIQLIGNREYSYLKEISEPEREAMVRPILAAHPPAVIFTRHLQPSELFLSLAEQYQVPVLQSGESTSNVVAKIVTYLSVALAPRIERHGVLVDVYGEGVLIVGESRIGKSEAALELVKRGHRFIADDQVEIRRVSDRELRGAPIKELQYISEIRGIGIINVATLFGMGSVKSSKRIDLVVKLNKWSDEGMITMDRIGLVNKYVDILGIKMPAVEIPVREGRNLAVIIEIAAMNHRQKIAGNNAALEFCEKRGIDPDHMEIEEEFLTIEALK